MTLQKIVSGGQTGVDRGALDAALECGFPCGGWCPPGRRAEDGPTPLTYPVVELAHGGYAERTVQNVVDSDGTLVIYFGELEGGTAKTVRHCIDRGKPCKIIDACEVTVDRAAQLVAAFVATHRIACLNVAGPRRSKTPKAEAYARAVIRTLLRQESRDTTRAGTT
jgi:hypothetical protein